MSTFAKVMRCTPQVFELRMSIITAVLQNMPSPLELGACITLVDMSDAQNAIQIILAVTSLFLAARDWHVPQFISYHYILCRFLSAICMHALFPYSLTFTCLAFLYPTFGKRPQSIPTPVPESGVDASEHVSTSTGDNISLDHVIAKLVAAGAEDTRRDEILAAAHTLRDSNGRDRKAALRKMANAWGVSHTEKVAGTYKHRSNSTLAEDIQAAVCKATLDWESRAKPSQTSQNSKIGTEAILKKARTIGAAMSTHAGGTIHSLPETSDDVMALSRVSPIIYQGTLRSGTIWRGDAQMLMTLPQGEAKLATLQTKERVAQAKAKAKAQAGASEHSDPPTREATHVPARGLSRFAAAVMPVCRRPMHFSLYMNPTSRTLNFAKIMFFS